MSNIMTQGRYDYLRDLLRANVSSSYGGGIATTPEGETYFSFYTGMGGLNDPSWITVTKDDLDNFAKAIDNWSPARKFKAHWVMGRKQCQ